ncbi:radical SAM protein [Clostridium isatidis]|uniref:radical SAM protein n=1 Tax=Clostridium isatidis TaxID=182773 RepID=UPI003AB056B2
MCRVSKNNIYLKLKKDPEKYLLVQGYRGSFDVVDRSIAEALCNGEKNLEYLKTLSDEDREILTKRGYLTSATEAEEEEIISKISDILNRVSKNTLTITIMPTYNCNFRCEYCFEQNLLKKGKEWLSGKMTAEIVDSIFIQLDKYKKAGKKISSVYLFGGEPLLRNNKDIVEYICKKCREAEIPISCISNGYDLDKYIDLLKEYKFDKIQITVDGIGKEHDKRRFLAGGQGTYNRIMNNIQLALDNGINITVRTNVNKKNTDSIEVLINEYKKRGWVGMKNFNYYFKATLRCYEEIGTALSDVELMHQLAEQYGDTPQRFQFNTIYQGLSNSIGYMLKNNSIAPLRSGYCGAHTGMYTIDPYGDIYPCWDVLAQDDCKIGKVDLEKNEFIFNDNHDKWKKRTVDKIEDCKECKYKLFCGGGCSAQAKVVSNDINRAYCDDFTNIFDEVVVEIVAKNLQIS